MVPHFGRHGVKQSIHGKPIKFEYKYELWQHHCIQFRPCAGKDTMLQEYADIGLGVGTSVVVHLVNTLPNVGDSKYYIVMDNFFTSPEFL